MTNRDALPSGASQTLASEQSAGQIRTETALNSPGIPDSSILASGQSAGQNAEPAATVPRSDVEALLKMARKLAEEAVCEKTAARALVGILAGIDHVLAKAAGRK